MFVLRCSRLSSNICVVQKQNAIPCVAPIYSVVVMVSSCAFAVKFRKTVRPTVTNDLYTLNNPARLQCVY